jgi:hypothetical protein
VRQRLVSALDQFRDKDIRELGAFVIAGLALIFSVAGVGDSNATEAGARYNVLAADTFAWYQAKNIRQTSYELARDELSTMLQSSIDAPVQGGSESGLTGALKERLAFYEREIARYESEPDPEEPDNPLKGEGKVQLLAQAEHFVEKRQQANERGNSFDYAVVLSSVGIVLASGGVLVASSRLVLAAIVFGAVAVVFLLNAAFTVVNFDFFIT